MWFRLSCCYVCCASVFASNTFIVSEQCRISFDRLERIVRHHRHLRHSHFRRRLHLLHGFHVRKVSIVTQRIC